MSKIGAALNAIKVAVAATPALTSLNGARYAVGLPPAGVLPAITMDGIYAPEAKQRELRANVHVWFAPERANKMGDVYELGEAFRVALLATGAILPSIWLHRPEPDNAVDHLVFPVTIYTDALPA